MIHRPRAKAVPNHNPNNLPIKTCACCGREFTWRKKWARDWPRVKYCSDACRREAKKGESKQTKT